MVEIPVLEEHKLGMWSKFSAGQRCTEAAGSLPGGQPGTGTRRVREGAVTPSLHPEVLGTHLLSSGRVLGIRQ